MRSVGFQKWVCVVGVFVLGIAFSGILWAEVVREVTPDGTLVLENGNQVVLAGVKLDDEGISVLRVLAQKQDLTLREDTSGTPGVNVPVYAYLRAKFLKFPSNANTASEEEEVMLNAFLVSQGAARVADDQVFAEKEHFIKLQEQAKKTGAGIWSYKNS